MANFLISTMPAVGHVNPILLTAAKLIERGHQVWWHTGTDAAPKVEAAGARFVPMRHTRDIVDTLREAQKQKGLAAANAAMISLFVEPMLGQLQDYHAILNDFSADALVVDMCSLGARLLHEQGGPVWATVGINPLRTADSPLYGSGQMPAKTALGRLQNRLMNWIGEHMLLRDATAAFNVQRQSVGLPPVSNGNTVFDSLMSPFLHMQGTTPAFEFPYCDLPPQVHFVGPMLPPMPTEFTPPRWWDELQAGRPVVHVTQGTVATEVGALVQPTMDALADENVLLVVTTPDPNLLGALPPNVRVERMIPHTRLLPHVDVMVTNGGYNGVKMALSFGVPLVAAGETEDKPEVASRIAWTGAGIDLRTGSPTSAQIKQAVHAVLDNPSFLDHARIIQADFARHDSAVESAELLEYLAEAKKPIAR